MDTTSNRFCGTVASSGNEVESAVFHPEVIAPVGRISEPGRMESVRAEVMRRVDGIQQRLVRRTASLRRQTDRKLERTKSAASTQLARLQDTAVERSRSIQSSMRENPMKWAGIAAGAGFAVGLLGRIADLRSRGRHGYSELVIIETHC